MLKPMSAEKKKQYRGSKFWVKIAAVIEPNSPPIAFIVNKNVFNSSAPHRGSFLAWITIKESTMTSEKATDRLVRKSMSAADFSEPVLRMLRPTMLRNWMVAKIRRYDLLLDPKIGRLSEITP